MTGNRFDYVFWFVQQNAEPPKSYKPVSYILLRLIVLWSNPIIPFPGSTAFSSIFGLELSSRTYGSSRSAFSSISGL